MKNKTQRKPTAGKCSPLHQLCNLIPPHLVPQLARDTGVAARARTFTPWSHVVSLLYAQLTHAIGLNDVCDALRLHSGPLSRRAGREPTQQERARHRQPGTLCSNGPGTLLRRPRPSGKLHPGFGRERHPRFAFRFKRVIHLVDATTLQLVARCLDWAKHRRRKAAAKCHLRLDLQTFLPRFALVNTAGEHENLRAHEVCAGVRAGEIVVFDKAYVDFTHLADLSARDVCWVTRAKDNLRCRVVRKFQHGVDGNILRDDLIGNSANAVRWQVWTALLTYVLLRFCAWLSRWGHSFTHLFALLRSALWQKLELRSRLEVYGTAGGGGWFLGTPEQAFLAGFS